MKVPSKESFAGIVLAAFAMFFSCDDDTATIGTELIPGHDNVLTSTAVYPVFSRSFEVDSVLANTNDCYLGTVVDPETRAKTTCDFLAQFHVLENYAFPSRDRMITDANGQVVADSCDVSIYFDQYYGDSLTTMKLLVQELGTSRVMEEGENSCTSLDPTEYVNSSSDIQRTVTYSVKDLTRPASETESSTYYRSIKVRLPADYASFILNKYYENPDFFRNSYQFIHHVCPGFYFKIQGGVGSMINTEVTALNVYFRYHSTTEAGNDTIIDGMQRMAATEEVIQNTRVDNSIPAEMLDPQNEYTYVKSPSGIFTEVTLPVNDVVAGEHYNDTINSARITFRRLNNETQNKYNLEMPATLLMVRKKDLFSFFEEGKVTDDRTSYLATFNSNYNAYEYSNIGRLITILKEERDEGAGVDVSDDEATRQAKYVAWEAKEENQDWNKVVLVPVAAEYSTSVNSYGLSVQTLLRLRNDMSMKSARLEGGSSGSLSLSVIYSKYNQ